MVRVGNVLTRRKLRPWLEASRCHRPESAPLETVATDGFREAKIDYALELMARVRIAKNHQAFRRVKDDKNKLS